MYDFEFEPHIVDDLDELENILREELFENQLDERFTTE